ncbi:MAG: hypothetical protein CVU05_10090, partial [Bacteroidetes bacterium HGW-Bacteroidetes-21]
EDFKREGGYMYQDNACIVPFRENIEKGMPFKTPSGKIEIEGEIYDAAAESGYIEKGDKIIVVKFETGQLYVRKIQ